MTGILRFLVILGALAAGGAVRYGVSYPFRPLWTRPPSLGVRMAQVAGPLLNGWLAFKQQVAHDGPWDESYLVALEEMVADLELSFGGAANGTDQV